MTRVPPANPSFEAALGDTPFVIGENDSDRYLRAFEQLADDIPSVDDVYAGARDAIRFVADDAFRRGFEVCHQNIVAPLQENTIGRAEALDQMRGYGRCVQLAISNEFEEEGGAPTSLSEAIADLTIPQPKLPREAIQ